MLQEPRSQGVTFPGASTAPSGWSTRHSRWGKYLGKKILERKNNLDFSLRSRERSEARERAGPGEARDNTPKKSISMGQIQREGARTQDTNGNTGQDTDIS